ncbi:hypothetical protein OB13_04390 [Pontibacter sp. HJ8]
MQISANICRSSKAYQIFLIKRALLQLQRLFKVPLYLAAAAFAWPFRTLLFIKTIGAMAATALAAIAPPEVIRSRKHHQPLFVQVVILTFF